MRVETGSGTVALRGHRGAITKVAFSPDGTLLASSSTDRTVRLWKIDPATGKPSTQPLLVLREHTDAVVDLYFADSGKALVTRSADLSVRRWRLEPASMADAVCGVMGRGFSLSRAEWNRSVGSAVAYDEHSRCPD